MFACPFPIVIGIVTEVLEAVAEPNEVVKLFSVILYVSPEVTLFTVTLKVAVSLKLRFVGVTGLTEVSGGTAGCLKYIRSVALVPVSVRVSTLFPVCPEAQVLVTEAP